MIDFGLAGRILLAALFIVAGVLHLVSPAPFLRIVPPFLPWSEALVAISGIAEISGGVGLLIPGLRRFAAYGLVVLLIAVFPANIYMAVAHVPFGGWMGQAWLQWLRLPFQFVLIAWAWIYTAAPNAPLEKRA
ncbi:MAG: DoxX family protein [Bryobacteraceae bacterium]